MAPLTVECAAIMKHGVMFHMPRPFRHWHIIKAMCNVLPPPNSGDEQGFMLSDGTFANRKSAALLACYSGQLRPGYILIGNRLYTEDLW